MNQAAAAGQKNFSVKINPKDSELIDVMWGEGFLDLLLEYEIDNLSDDKELLELLASRYKDAGDYNPSNLSTLVDMISTKGVIAESSESDGYFYCDNDFWELRIIKNSHEFSVEDLSEIYQENQYALMGCGVVINGVNIDDIPLESYRKILGVVSWDNWSTAAIKSMLHRYKSDLKNRNSDRHEAIKIITSRVLSGELDGLFDKDPNLDKSISSLGDNIIFIDDPLRRLALPDSYQISKPSIMLGGKTSIYKQDNAFAEFDKIEHQSIKEFDDYIVFVGVGITTFTTKGADLQSKRLFVLKNTSLFKAHLNANKNKKHTDEIEGMHARGNSVDFDDLMCDYCATINRVPSTAASFICKNCKNEN